MRTRTVLRHPWACTCIESKKRVGGGQEERMRRAARGMGMARGGGGEGGYEYATVLRPPKHRGTAEHLGGHEVVAMYPRVGRRGGRGVPLSSSKARRIEALRPVRTSRMEQGEGDVQVSGYRVSTCKLTWPLLLLGVLVLFLYSGTFG